MQETGQRHVDLDYISQRPMSYSANEFKKSQNLEPGENPYILITNSNITS